MRARMLISAIGTLVACLVLSMTPVSADETLAIDFCASKSSGKVRAITDGACTSKERSLGAQPITRPEKRPTALLPKFKARYSAAKAAAKSKGYTLAITSGYRSLAQQKILYKRAIARHGSAAEASKWVLPPEKSNHPWGEKIIIKRFLLAI